VLGGGHGDVPGAKDIVLDSLNQVRLHHRHMLIGGRMKDDGRPVARKYFTEPRRVLNAAYVTDERDARVPGKDILLDLK
jgi:hypothetical protein